MLKKFELRNCRNFKDSIVMDLSKIGGYQYSTDCISDGFISKALIYGRNATGKTNLGECLMDITDMLSGRLNALDSIPFLNADTSEDHADFIYTFLFDDTEIEYSYSKNALRELVFEGLKINGKNVFEINPSSIKVFSFNSNVIAAETLQPERYVRALDEQNAEEDHPTISIPFLRWILANAVLKLDSPLLKLSDFVEGMSISAGNVSPRFFSRRFYKSLAQTGTLSSFERFLNEMGIECELVLRELPEGDWQLYFKHKRLVPFGTNASSGTRMLMQIYRQFIENGRPASFIYMDEFDAFYHYEMAEKVIRFFKEEFPRTQIVLTTHNTNLMTNRLFRPDCLFILSRAGKLTALCDATLRELREGHNLEKMYISGEFEKYE